MTVPVVRSIITDDERTTDGGKEGKRRVAKKKTEGGGMRKGEDGAVIGINIKHIVDDK